MLFFSGNIVIYDDNQAEKKYLNLDELGVVLKSLGDQLSGN